MGVRSAEVLCHAHKHGGQIQSIKKNLHTLTTLMHTIVYYQLHVTNFEPGQCLWHYFSDHFCAELSLAAFLCDRKAVRREIKYLHMHLGCSRQEEVVFSSWKMMRL